MIDDLIELFSKLNPSVLVQALIDFWNWLKEKLQEGSRIKEALDRISDNLKDFQF